MIKPEQIPALSGEGLPFSTPPWGITDHWLMAAEEDRVTLEGWPLVGCPCPSGWHYSHVQRVSTNWIQWVMTKEMNLGERLIEEGGGWRGREGDLTKLYHHTWVPNFQKLRKQKCLDHQGSWTTVADKRNRQLNQFFFASTTPHLLKETGFFSRHKYAWKTQILLPDGG